MFSLKIVDTDAFLDMPHSSQLLYFHLSMRADDDGFVSNHRKIMRMTGAQVDDFKVLLAKKFIIPFESGICVVKHWKIHNYIQKDRYSETTYLDEKAQLREKDNGVYTVDTKRIQNGDTGKVRLGKSKVREGKATKSKTLSFNPQDIEMVDILVSLIQENNPEWQMRGRMEKWAEDINKIHRLDKRTYEQIKFMIQWVQNDSFWRQNILSASKLREKFNDLIPKVKAGLSKDKPKWKIWI